MEKLVVIGGTAAGMSAAARARRGNNELPIVVFEGSGHVTYGSCGLPYYISGEIADSKDLVTYTPEKLKRDRNIDVRIHHKVVEINPGKKFVKVQDLITGREFTESYTKLVVATGASPVIPPIPGITLDNIVSLRNIEDGVIIKNLVQSGQINKVAILGAGFIGLEMAEALRKHNLQVSVFEMLPRILPLIDPKLSTLVEQELEKHGVKLHKGTKVIAFEATKEGKVQRVVTEGSKTWDTDMVLVSVGAKPNSEIAAEAGIQTGLKGGIVVDRFLRTSATDIWACGDCTVTFHRITKEPVYIPLGTTANKQGKIVGENLLGGRTTFPGVLGTQVTKIFDIFVASTGLTEDQARNAGFDPLSVTIKHWDKASYYPGAKPIHLCLTLDKNQGKILGAQMVGSEGVAKRIDVIVAAITAGMNVYELNELDLAYAPPVSPVYDPVLIAASVGIKALERLG